MLALGLKYAAQYAYHELSYKVRDKIIQKKFQKVLNESKSSEKNKDVKIEEEKSEEVKEEKSSLMVTSVPGTDDVKISDPDYDVVLITDDEIDENLEEAYQSIKADGNHIKLILLCILYMSNIIKPEQMFRRCKTQDDYTFINSVVKFYSGVCVLPQYNTLQINEVTNIKLIEQVVNFESTYDKLMDNEALCEIISKTSDLIVAFQQKQIEVDGGSEGDVKVPLFFTSKNLNLTRHIGMDKGLLNKLQKDFEDLLVNYSYQFNKNGDLVELVIYNNGRMDSYYIDPGTIIGNGFNVICLVPGDTIMVNYRHKDILEKVFNNPNYILNVEEIQRVSQDMFCNTRIYYMVDMSKGAEILPKLSGEDFHKLGNKLTSILNLPWNDISVPFSRLRFRSFKSIDDFTLVSDDKCKIPIPNDMCNVIGYGLTVKVNEDTITVKYNEESTQFKIEKYNVM